MTIEGKLKALLMTSVSVAGVLTATSADAWRSPTKHRYLTRPLQVCDQGIFYVGGAPKITPYQLSSNSGDPNRQIIIGQMFVQFQTPMKSTSWPLIMVHGSGYTGSCVQGTAGGTEGWADYTVRHGIPTYVVDQSGRGRSGFDHTPSTRREICLLKATSPAHCSCFRSSAANGAPTPGRAGSVRWCPGHRIGIPPPAK